MPGADLNTLRGMGAAAHGGGVRLPLPVREAVASSITHTFTLGLIVLAVALLAIIVMPPIGSVRRGARPNS
jgi:hypothetical protein